MSLTPLLEFQNLTIGLGLQTILSKTSMSSSYNGVSVTKTFFLDRQTYNFSQIALGVAMEDLVCLLGVNGHMGPGLSFGLLRVSPETRKCSKYF